MTEALEQAAKLIAHTSPVLAQAWRRLPHLRVKVAQLYAQRLNEGADPSADPHPHAVLVLDTALNDKDQRFLETELIVLSE